MRYYKFTNSIPSKLGREPLPDGSVQAFRTVTDDHLSAFTGSTSVKYIPIGESVELELGADVEVLVKPVLMDWVKTDLRYDPTGNVTGWARRWRRRNISSGENQRAGGASTMRRTKRW